MVRLCSYVLENGKRCHCAANHAEDFCRHHTPQALRDRQSSQPAEPADAPDFNPLREWRALRRFIGQCETQDFNDILENIMAATAEGAMTHRTAGRLLVVLYHRRAELEQQTLRASEPIPDSLLNMFQAAVNALPDPDARRGLSQLMPFPSHNSNGPEAKTATY
jgi:hypothetical protein